MSFNYIYTVDGKIIENFDRISSGSTNNCENEYEIKGNTVCVNGEFVERKKEGKICMDNNECSDKLYCDDKKLICKKEEQNNLFDDINLDVAILKNYQIIGNKFCKMMNYS